MYKKLLAGKDSAAALAAVNGMPNGGPLHAALASGDDAHSRYGS